ncbi:VWA domain-containing protein [Streptomyces sp. NPDC048018]|uniref:VWA domain-containing protein n=1 Tax=Streptomyces sp. NPDC048018 TaxID=3365499 RepID=UPI00371C96B6
MHVTVMLTGRRSRRRGALLLAGALLALSGPLGGPPAAARAHQAAPAVPAAEGADPIDFAVVVDQSESLADEDLARETEAAALLSQGEISERSRAAVIGFGSSEKPGQSPVREVCPRTVVDAAGRQRLSDCVKQLASRDRRVGPGTDFPAAIRQAVARLTENDENTGGTGGTGGSGSTDGTGSAGSTGNSDGTGSAGSSGSTGNSGSTDGTEGDAGSGAAGARAAKTPKVVFLLTDGRLDVADSPEYGADPASRRANGEKRLEEELARAREAGVQIWPLGFGDEIDRAALTAMADGGYRGACSDVPGSVPRMRVVAGSAGIDKALQETFAAARCARVSEGTVGKPPADLYVTIPAIATDGSLTVSKHDPKVRVTYYDPQKRKMPTHGDFDGSTFEVSGEDGPVEALRVKNPLPGRWRVHIEAPEGHQDREVAVRAIWQGRLSSAVLLDPVAPRPGQQAVVEVRMQTRRGVVISDPRQLAGVSVGARLSGAGFPPVSIRLTDDGQAPDRRAGDVRFTGTLTVPAGATGELEIVTEMAAPGVTSDRRPFHTAVTEGTPPLSAQISVERVTVHPGDTVRGYLDITNNDGAPHTLRLGLGGQQAEQAGQGGQKPQKASGAPGSAPVIAPATVVAEPGPATRAEFTLTLPPDTPLGELGGLLTVVDTTRGDRVLDTSFLDVLVEAPPTWWDLWGTYAVAGALVLLAAAAVVGIRLAARRRRQDLAGVTIELRKDGRILDTLTVRTGQSAGGEFLFSVEEPRGAAPTLRRARGAAAAHRLRRTGSGDLHFRPHRGREAPIRAGEPVELEECEVVVRDGGRPGRGGPRTRTRLPRRTTPGPRTAPGADDPSAPAPTTTTSGGGWDPDF